MNCEETVRLLDAYVDQELFLKDSLEVEKHLRRCCSCDMRHNNIVSMRHALKKCKRHAPSALLQDRIQYQLRRKPGIKSRAQQFLKKHNWLGVAAPAFVMGGVVALTISLNVVSSGRDHFDGEIVSAHIRSMMASHLTDVKTSDKHQIKPWINKVLDYSPPVEDLSEKGYPLVGVRLDYIRQRKVVSLVYQLRNHYINVFVLPMDPDNGEIVGKNVKGYSLHNWSFNQLSYVAVSDVSEKDLLLFSENFRAATLSL